MNNEFDDFNNAIDNIKVDRTKPMFKINQLKLEHFHWNSGDIDVGMPLTTSIELISNYNFEKENVSVSHIIAFNNKHGDYQCRIYWSKGG